MDQLVSDITEFSTSAPPAPIQNSRLLDEKIEFGALFQNPRPAVAAGNSAAGLSCSALPVFLPFAARCRARFPFFSPLATRRSSLPMLLDFEVQRSTRRCAATDRPLEPGDVCYSVLEVQGADVVRHDYCGEAWNGPPDEAFGWWKSRVPGPTTRKIKLAPNDVLLELFDQLADRPDHQDMRYVLTLLLLRRRVLRLDVALGQPCEQALATMPDAAAELMNVYCPKRDAAYDVPVVMPREARIDEIQEQLSELLVSGNE
jgi:hypothetical protein